MGRTGGVNSPVEPLLPRVWAPDATEVEIVTAEGRHHMDRSAAEGWWDAPTTNLGHGDSYAFCINGGDPRPDPR